MNCPADYGELSGTGTNNANIAPAPLLFVAAAGVMFSDFSTSNHQEQDMISDMSTSRRLAVSQSNCHD